MMRTLVLLVLCSLCTVSATLYGLVTDSVSTVQLVRIDTRNGTVSNVGSAVTGVNWKLYSSASAEGEFLYWIAHNISDANKYYLYVTSLTTGSLQSRVEVTFIQKMGAAWTAAYNSSNDSVWVYGDDVQKQEDIVAIANPHTGAYTKVSTTKLTETGYTTVLTPDLAYVQWADNANSNGGGAPPGDSSSQWQSFDVYGKKTYNFKLSYYVFAAEYDSHTQSMLVLAWEGKNVFHVQRVSLPGAQVTSLTDVDGMDSACGRAAFDPTARVFYSLFRKGSEIRLIGINADTGSEAADLAVVLPMTTIASLFWVD